MILQQKFTEKYGISPLKLVEDAHIDNLGSIKRNGLITALEYYIDKEKLNIEVTSEFQKDLVEAFAEAGERFPESGKTSSMEADVLLSIPSVNPSVPKSKGTLENFKEVVGKDELRPVMSGVFVSEDGTSLVGTDAHKLVVQKTNEYSEYAGKIIDLSVYIQSKGKKLTFIDGKYPNYNAVIPRDNPNEVKNFDTYALYNFSKSAIAVHKLIEQTLFNINLELPNSSSNETIIASFNPVLAADLLSFALVNGWNKFTLEYSETTRAFIMNFGEGNIGLLMPILNREGGEIVKRGTEILTPEEIMDKYKFAGKMKSVKPTTTKTARPSAPISSEPFKPFKGDYDEDDTTYVLRENIESITLTNGEVLGKNDVVHGFYRVKKKMAHGGSVDGNYEVIVKMPKGLITKKDFDGFSKQEIIDWCEERGWKYNQKGEKLGGRVLEDYEFFIKSPSKREVVVLPKKKMAHGGGVDGELKSFEVKVFVSPNPQTPVEETVVLKPTKSLATLYVEDYLEPNWIEKYGDKYLGFEILTQKMAHGGGVEYNEIYALAEDLKNRLKGKGINVFLRQSKNGVFIYGEKNERGKYKYETYISFSETPENAKDFLSFEESEFERLHKFAHGGSMYADGGTLSAMEEREIENFVGSLFNRAKNKIENDGGMSLFVLSDSLNAVEGSLGNPKFYLGVKKTSSSKPVYVVGTGYLSSEMLVYDSYKSDERFLETESVKKARAFLTNKIEKQILHLKSLGKMAHGGSMYADGGGVDEVKYFYIKGRNEYAPQNLKDTYAEFYTENDLIEYLNKWKGNKDVSFNSITKVYNNGESKDVTDFYLKNLHSKNKLAHGGSMYSGGGNMFEKPIAMYREVSGKTRSLPQSTEVYESEINRFIDYVHDFYEEEGYSKAEVKTAVNKYLNDLGNQDTYGGGDSIDREKVYKYLESDSLEKSYKSGLITQSEYEQMKSQKDKKYATGGSMYAGGGKIPSRPFLVEIKPLFKGEEPQIVRISPDGLGEFTAGYTIYADANSTRKVGYLAKHEMESKIENGEYKIISDSKMAHGGSMYAKGGGVEKPKDFKTYAWKTKQDVIKDNYEIYEDEEMTEIEVIDYYKERIKRGYDYAVQIYTKGKNPKQIFRSQTFDETLDEYYDESDSKYAHGGSMSSSHEVGDTVTFNSVMGGTKTGTIISKMGEEGFRIQVGNGFATVKKSAIV